MFILGMHPCSYEENPQRKSFDVVSITLWNALPRIVKAAYIYLRHVLRKLLKVDVKIFKYNIIVLNPYSLIFHHFAFCNLDFPDCWGPILQ